MYRYVYRARRTQARTHNNVLNIGHLLYHGKLSIALTDDEFGEKTVSILLDGEESEMVFIDHPSIEMSVSVQCLILFA